jgi:hypothetical protein
MCFSVHFTNKLTGVWAVLYIHVYTQESQYFRHEMQKSLAFNTCIYSKYYIKIQFVPRAKHYICAKGLAS